MKNKGRLLSMFYKDEKGNVAIMTAFALVPLLMLLGLALDGSAVIQKETKLQDALDAAALAAITEPKKSKSRKVFEKFLEDSGYEDITITEFKRQQAAGRINITAKASGEYLPVFQSIFGVSEIAYDAETSVTGGTMFSGIRFTPTFGSGYLDKEFKLWVRRPNTPTPELLATYNWTSIAPITFFDGSSPGRLNSSTNGSIDLGDFTEFFMSTTVNDRWNTYTEEQLIGVYGEDYTLFSNEPGHGDHFVVNGRVLDVDEDVDFSRDFNCNSGVQRFEWEDAPGLAETGTDFRFNVTGECNVIDPGTIRISQ